MRVSKHKALDLRASRRLQAPSAGEGPRPPAAGDGLFFHGIGKPNMVVVVQSEGVAHCHKTLPPARNGACWVFCGTRGPPAPAPPPFARAS